MEEEVEEEGRSPLFLDFDAKTAEYVLLPEKEAFAQLAEREIEDADVLNAEAIRSWIAMMKSFRERTGLEPVVKDEEVSMVDRLISYNPFPQTGILEWDPDRTHHFLEPYQKYTILVSYSAFLYGDILSPSWTLEEFFGLVHMDMSSLDAYNLMRPATPGIPAMGGHPPGTFILRLTMRERVALALSYLDDIREMKNIYIPTEQHYSTARGGVVGKVMNILASRLREPRRIVFSFTEMRRLDEFDWFNEAKEHLLKDGIGDSISGAYASFIVPETWVYDLYPHRSARNDNGPVRASACMD